MGPEAAYWAALTGAAEPGSPMAGLLDNWLAARNRSARELFELHPEMLAAALGRPIEALAPLLAIRRRLPQTQRLLDRLGRAGVDLLLRWDRRYPRALRGLADERRESVLWYAGSLDLLEQGPVAIAGPRDVGPEGRDFARSVAAAVASQGCAVLGGLAQSVDRAALEAAMARERGGGIAVLGQGIAKALPDLLRLQDELRAGRLLVLSRLPLEAAWQPAYEAERGRSAVQLMRRLVLVEARSGDGSWQLAQSALQAGRAVLVRQEGTEACEALLAQGAMPISWPAQGEDALTEEALRPPEARGRSGRDPARAAADDAGEEDAGESEMPPDGQAGPEHGHTIGTKPAAMSRHRRTGAARGIGGGAVDPAAPDAPDQLSARPTMAKGRNAPTYPQARDVAAGTPTPRPGLKADGANASGPMPDQGTALESGPPLEGALLRYLQRHKRRVTSKGLLLQALPAEEWAIDQALAALIAAGQVAEHAHRTGAGYAPAAPDAASDGGGNFQLSLFGQPEEGPPG